MKGWLTRAAGAILVLYGLIGWAAGLHDYDTALTSIGNGLGFIGLRRAHDKTVERIEEVTQEQTETINDIVRSHQQ